MKKFYLLLSQFFLLLGYFYSNSAQAQLTATFTGYESRCAATGAIKIVASGGSGSYQYKAEGPVNISFTGQDSITGLSKGFYKITVNDILTNETISQNNILVKGTYSDPKFFLGHTDVSCDNGYNGSISVSGLIIAGRGPFVFSIVAPSAMGVGTISPTGVFTGLKAGLYSVQMTDSCGGIQTRTVTLNNYSWNIDTHNFTKLDCDHASGYITIKDSKGNDSKYTAIPGFSYGAVRAPGDTIWSADGNFSNVIVTGIPSIGVFAKDACGNIKKVTQSLKLVPTIDANVSLNKSCSYFSATITGIINFFGADFYLFDNGGTQIDHNTTGTFNNLPYGSYCIKAHDACTDTTIQRCFNATAPVLNVSDVNISNKTCSTFTANLSWTSNLTSPTYCIVNSATGDTLNCNASGTFNNLSTGGNYCMIIKDGCVDTTITRCFSVSKPIPKINPTIGPVYVTCTNFGLNVGGDSLTNPTYCLYDINNNQIGSCNSNGKFDSIPLGSYYVTIHDACLDTTIRRDINVGAPKITNDVNISLSNQTCTTFTATAKTNNLKNASFCLFTASDSTLVNCNINGIFNGLAYGNYYIKSRNGCPDTTMFTSFSATRTLPTVNPTLKITNKTCTTFTAQIIGQNNLINPNYCLIDAVTNQVVGCSTVPIATNIPYGSYIARIISGCNDTIIIPFSQYPRPLSMTVSALKSCTLGQTKFNINVNGVLPVNIKIYTPKNNLVRDSDFTVSNFQIDNLPGLDSTDKYTVIGTDGCGNKDTLYVAPQITYLIHTPSVLSKCPGSVWLNGSGNINTTVSTNISSVSVMIILKNGVPQSIPPDYASGTNYTFNDIGPGTYVISYHSNDGCNINVYDTTTISSYIYPKLSNTTAYQCDLNGFSVGVVTSGGVGPFTYQIIGSEPTVPDLSGPPQTSPIFTINNGQIYSLVRLRALDACGNATLGDFPVLPLVNNGIQSPSECLQTSTTLTVDSLYNASYSWYKKVSPTDSIEVSNDFKYDIPSILPSDTGVYVCNIVVNSGCISRTYYFHLDGNCGVVLASSLADFYGSFENGKVNLSWIMNSQVGLKQIVVERRINNNYVEIGKVDALSSVTDNQYRFVDVNPGTQNFYRLKIVSNDNTYNYSKVILLQKQTLSNISIYPNPADDILNIEFFGANNHSYQISMSNILNQKVKEIVFNTQNGNKLQIKRSANMTGGIYILQFMDLNTKEVFSRKIIFGNQ
ncbi:MAG TPA: T9SS type A sorting domain-containing protein [Hanamia sp.]